MNKIFKWILLLLFIVFIVVFTFYHIGKETILYRCDFIEYNLFYYDYAKLLVSDFNTFVHNMCWEVYNINRNPLMNIFIIPFFYIFKESRAGYITAVNIVFMLPCMILLYKILNNYILKPQCNKVIYYLMMFSIIFLFPPLWMASLSGIPDICGMVPVLGAFYLYYKFGCNKETPLKYLFIMAGLLYLSFLFRRWYSVVVVVFLASIFLENIIQSFNKPFNLKETLLKNIYTIKNILIISILITVFALLIQYGYVHNIFVNEGNERDIYTVAFNQFKILFIEILGVIYLIFAAAGSIFNLKNKYVRFAFINLVLYLSAYITGMHNQLLWINHYLFIACMLVILICSALNNISNIIKPDVIRNVVMSLVIVYSICNFIVCFETPRINQTGFLFSRNFYFDDTSADYHTVKDLYEYLENEYQNNKNIKAAQYGLNNSFGYYQLRGINPKSEFLKNNYVCETIFDSDFNALEINADYIINMTPLNLFFDDKTLARVLYTTNEMFEKNTSIAKNYKKVKEYMLSDGTKLTLYKKIKPLSKKQIKEYLEQFYEFYPDWKNREFVKLYE